MFRTNNAILLDLCRETTEFIEEHLKDQQLPKLLRDNSTSMNLSKIHVPNSMEMTPVIYK